MEKVVLNRPLPDFTFHSTDPKLMHLKILLGKNIVLYFYPKDNTPGCTLESQNFKVNYHKFAKLKTCIIGISRDNLHSHDKFACKLALPFPLIADEDETLCKLFNVIVTKNMYGRQVQGIERSTFLIDKKGIVRNIWRKVRVPGHVEAVLEAVSQLEDKT